MATKEVLVELERSKRPVSFVGGVNEIAELKKAVIKQFSDKVTNSGKLIVQLKSEEWQGEWVDILDGQQIQIGAC